MKKDYQKALKKLTLFFLLNPVPLNGQSYQKQKGPGTSEQLLLRLQNKFKKIPSLVIYYILYITFANLYKSIHDIKNYSTYIYPFESGKCGKEGRKLQKLEYLEKEKSFLDEIKNIFHTF